MQCSDDIGTGIYGAGRYLARWTLVDGYPRCIDPPMLLWACAASAAADAIAVNRAVSAIAARADQVEAAARMTAGDPPPVTVLAPGPDVDAPPVAVPNPGRAAWDAAVALLEDAAGDSDLQHLLRTRAGALSADAGGQVEAPWSLSLPPVPALDPLSQTADWDGAAWTVRPLTAAERAAWPLQPPPVPATVSRVQLRLALAARGLLETVDGAVQLTGNTELTERWGAAVMERASPYLAEMAAALGLSAADIDDIFRQAAGL